MRRTGHRSSTAVRKYKRASDEMRANVSHILDPPKPIQENCQILKEISDNSTTPEKRLCTERGIPRSKIIWYHGKKKLTMNKDDSEMAYYSLILNRNHNEQIYTCIAEHDMLRTPLNQSITLNILYHPRVQWLWPKGPVSVGHHVNLSCSYYSNPLDAEILWTKNCQNVDSSQSIVTKIAVENHRNLTEVEDMTKYVHGVTAIMIENVTRTDAGAYTCNVINTEGSASETLYLVVQVPQGEVVRHSPIEIEMQEVSNNEEDVHEGSRNLPSCPKFYRICRIQLPMTDKVI
ncbi:ROBO1 [Mytilus coruscus]|uniref:ROBO1 n=1 Tax=Mytilus coruscus TaxID=42192 RepID=A0A6J8DYG4_MYTCO|nr:ROBO1 [Mytilus coruscus]